MNNLSETSSLNIGYGSMYLVPQKCVVNSRSQCDTSVELGNRKFNIPVYASNMKSVVSQQTCKYFARRNLFYTMHRFNVDTVNFYNEMKKQNLFVSISVGVNDDSYTEMKKMKDSNTIPQYITLDIANAWSTKGHAMTKWLRQNFKDSFLIVGNVATAEACQQISTWGADGIKCGIAGGNVCITKNKTGFHVPMVRTISDCASVCYDNNVKCIADGGIVQHGDIAKAISLGADMVMAGSLFAGYQQSAGSIVQLNGKMFKEYYGSASQHNKGQYKNVQGKKTLVPFRGGMDRLIKQLKQDIQSSVSYSGGKDLASVKGCPFIIVK